MTTTKSRSDEDDDTVLLEEEPTITFTRVQCAALIRECQHSWISYENPVAREMISKMWDFVHGK